MEDNQLRTNQNGNSLYRTIRCAAAISIIAFSVAYIFGGIDLIVYTPLIELLLLGGAFISLVALTVAEFISYANPDKANQITRSAILTTMIPIAVYVSMLVVENL